MRTVRHVTGAGGAPAATFGNERIGGTRVHLIKGSREPRR